VNQIYDAIGALSKILTESSYGLLGLPVPHSQPHAGGGNRIRSNIWWR